MRRLATALLVAAFLAAGCSDDDGVAGPVDVGTTIPQVTASPTTDTVDADSGEPPADTDGATDAAGTDDEGDDPDPVPPAPAADPDVFRAVSVTIERVTDLDQPIDAVVAPNGEWWIAERHGGIFVVDPDTGTVGDLVVDVSDETFAEGEGGLLGLAVDDEALYVNFTDRAGHTQVEAILLGADGRPGERVRLLTIEQPFANHNGGGLAIGPDGLLYVGVGDGGGGGDPLEAGQDPEQLLGSILRIEPTPTDPVRPYYVPEDNPYVDEGGAIEIFAIGLRNPWRFSFDPATDDLWVADVGQSAWEEITLLLGANGWGRGANLGWNLREGIEAFAGDRPEGNVDPVFVYGHSGEITGCSITGGEVYRGSAIPALQGAYVFGDYCTSRLWAISVASGEVVFVDLGIDLPGGELVDFSVDPDGELVALSLNGAVVRIVPS